MTCSQENLRTGNLTDEEWKKMNISADEVDKLEHSGNFMMFEGVNNLSTIKRLIKKYKPFAVAIDQLAQLTDDRKFDSNRERFSYMTNQLKRVAMTEDCAVLLAAQVNRSAQETEPTMANLKESGSIEEDSDNVILLHREPLSEKDIADGWNERKQNIKLKIEKQRGGATGFIRMAFIANKFTFYEIAVEK